MAHFQFTDYPMSTSLATLIRLRAIQNKTRCIFEKMNDIQYRLQYHPDLSPAGWYLNHGFFMENYWLHTVIQGAPFTLTDHTLFLDDSGTLAERGPKLPKLQGLIDNILNQQDSNDLLLMDKIPPLSNHPLFKDEYIENVIIQQYAHNYEAIYMVLYQMALKQHRRHKTLHPYTPENILTPQALVKNIIQISRGNYNVGESSLLAHSIEKPAHNVSLNDFFITNTPVTNAQYLLFMESNGYNIKDNWSHEGWQWRKKNTIHHPEFWFQCPKNNWYGVDHNGPHELNSNDFVYGLSQYEADAFARWAGGRLPHEHEWETAARLGLIKHTTHVWEWCHNKLEPYEGFKLLTHEKKPAYYNDKSHYIVKGASQFTRKELWRASFRNAYLPHQRHMFTGCRLVYN